MGAAQKQVILAKYAEARQAWTRSPSAFRPVHPPMPPVNLTERSTT